MASDDNTSDLVLLPNDFNKILLPAPLIEFFKRFEVHYQTATSFPMEVLRSLYRTDFKIFYNVVYFLSLYGCNFHSAKNNSFFPPDVSDVEDVLTFSGASDSRFSIAEMNEYGMWDFFANASSSKCMILSGVVVARLQKNSESSFVKLKGCPLISIASKRLYGDVEQNESQDEVTDKLVKEAPFSSSALLEVKEEDDTSMAGAECETQSLSCDEEDNGLVATFSNEFFFDSDKFENLDGCNALDSAPIDSVTGVCSPRFWIRFASSFFAMNKKAKEVYSNVGYKTFGDLVDFKNADIKTIVDGISDCLEDPYLTGIYENELICFCKSKDSFLTDVGNEHSLKEFLSPSGFTLSCIQEHPSLFYYFDSGISPFLTKPLEISSQKSPQISDFITAYLGMLRVIDLSFVGNGLLSHSINDYGLSAENEYLSYFLRPINAVDSLLCSLMGLSPFDAFGIDHEIYSLWVPDFLHRFYSNIGKYANEKHKKHLEILNLKETTNITLEALGQKYGVTRERIRQIEAKVAKALSSSAEVLMDSLFQLQNFLPLGFAKTIPGLYSYIKSENSKYYADEDLGIALRKSSKAIISKTKKTISKSESLQDCNRLDGFYRKNGFSLYGWLNVISYRLQYTPYPKFMAQKVSLMELGREYLLSKGTTGYDINKDENEVMNFYRTNAPYMKNVTYRAISANVKRCGAVLRGMSVYVSSDLITEEQKNIVRRILHEEKFECYGFTGLSLFEKHKDELLPVGIDNGYFFYGIASTYNSEDYQFGGRSLRISLTGKKPLAELVEHYISENGPIVKVVEFLRDLHLKNSAIQQISNLTKYDSSTLTLKSLFKLSKPEFVELEPFIDDKINQQGFCHAYDIIGSQIYFDESKNGFFQINQIGNNPSRLIYFLDAIAERYQITKYHFSHHCDCISAFDKPIETKQDMAMVNFKGRTFTKKEAESFFEKFHLGGNVSGSDFYSGWTYFIDNDILILKQDLQITDETIKDVSRILTEYYGEELFITSITALNRLRYNGSKEQFAGKPMELASVLSDSELSDWCNPVNDIGITSGFFRTILINKKIVDQDVSYSNLIRIYILKNHHGNYLSVQDIQKELKEQELIDNHVTIQVLNSIFSEWFSGPIVEVPDES